MSHLLGYKLIQYCTPSQHLCIIITCCRLICTVSFHHSWSKKHFHGQTGPIKLKWKLETIINILSRVVAFLRTARTAAHSNNCSVLVIDMRFFSSTIKSLYMLKSRLMIFVVSPTLCVKKKRDSIISLFSVISFVMKNGYNQETCRPRKQQLLVVLLNYIIYLFLKFD